MDAVAVRRAQNLAAAREWLADFKFTEGPRRLDEWPFLCGRASVIMQSLIEGLETDQPAQVAGQLELGER